VLGECWSSDGNSVQPVEICANYTQRFRSLNRSCNRIKEQTANKVHRENAQ